MLKLGVVERDGVRRPRTLAGRRRYVSLLLLRELAADRSVSAEEYDRLAGHACMPNGVWKLTGHGRLRTLDTAVVELLARRHPSKTPLVVCDLAASTGATSVDFFRALQAQFAVRFVASDLYRDLIAVRDRRRGMAVVFDGSGQEVQYLWGRFVLPAAPPESIAYPVNRALKALMQRSFVPRARHALRDAAVSRLQPFAAMEADGYEIVKLPMLTRDTLAAIAAGDGFTFEEWNIFQPLPERAHVVRAMNILTPEHFPDDQRARAVQHCVEAVLPGGLFIVGSSPTADPASVQASVYAVEAGKLVRLAALNGGSEIDGIVARSYAIEEPAREPAEGLARAARHG